MQASEKNGCQILVVDDEPTVCRAIMLLLKHDGHTVQTAESGAAALALYEAGKFDLVITDYSMPDMKGDQLAALIKQHRPGQPIIMATAFADDLKSGGKLNGNVDFLLNKPFSLEALRAAVAQAAGR